MQAIEHRNQVKPGFGNVLGACYFEFYAVGQTVLGGVLARFEDRRFVEVIPREFAARV